MYVHHQASRCSLCTSARMGNGIEVTQLAGDEGLAIRIIKSHAHELVKVERAIPMFWIVSTALD